MIEKRQNRLIKQLQNHDIQFAFILSPIHIYYYTNFYSNPHERFLAFIVDAMNGKTYLFLPELDVAKGKEIAEVDYIIPISDTDNGYNIVKQMIHTPIKSISIEKNIMTVAELERIQQSFANVEINEIDTFIAQERLRKSEVEIEQVKKAIQITEKGLEHIVQYVKKGMTEIEVKMELEFYLQSIGANDMAFDTLVLSGPNSAIPHGISGTRQIKEGDFLLFDVGVTVNHYHSDITRTFIVGKGTVKQYEIYETVRKANERAILSVQVGEQLKNIDLAARKQIETEGYGEFFTHRTGHGLGLEVHEEPSIHEQNEMQVCTGMLFTIEPGVYIPNLGGVRIEDDIYINELENTEVLTSFTKQLICLEG